MLSKISHLLLKNLGNLSRAKKALLPLSFEKNIKIFTPFSQVQLYSSFHKSIHSFRQSEYQEGELDLLNDPEPQKIPERRKAMEKYLQSKDLNLLTSDEIATISDTLCGLAVAHNFGGDRDKALRYLQEDQDLNQKMGIRDTVSLGYNFYFQGRIYLEQNNLADAKSYLDEAERICSVLGDNQDTNILKLECDCCFARYYAMQNDQDSALDLYNSILERAGGFPQEQLAQILLTTYEGRGSIYASRNEAEKAMEDWAKGLEIAIQHLGEISHEAYAFTNPLTELLFSQGRFQEALPYAKQSLQIALEVLPEENIDHAINYSRLGHIYASDEKLAEGLDCFKKAIQILEKQPPQDAADFLSNCYFQSASILAIQGGNPQEVSKLLAKASDSIALIANGETLADVYFGWAEHLKATSKEDSNVFFLKGAQICENCEPVDSAKLLNVYSNLGNQAYNEENYEKAYEFMKKAESHVKAAKLDPEFAKAFYAYIMNAAMRVGDAPGGIKYSQKVVDYYKICENPHYVGGAYFNMGILHDHQGRLEKALEALQKSLEFTHFADEEEKPRISLAKERIEEIQGRLKVRNQKNSEASDKISQVLKTFKFPGSKK